MDKTRAKGLAVELGGQLVGEWKVGEYLGNGFSGVVVSAENQGNRAALKIIDPEMVERAGEKRQLARVLRETELVGHGHSHLVEILDGGKCQTTGHLYVVMELLEPLTLGAVKSKLPRDRIGPLIGQLADAARFLETRGVAHRDIKPDNTVVSKNYETAKLLDLGVILPPLNGGGQPNAGTGDHFVGTARYSPPEFLNREEEQSIEAWRAITFYQLGATLHDLLMRRAIFDEFCEPAARLYRAVQETIPVIEADDVEPWLIDLARRCLHKDWRVRKELVTWEDFKGPRRAAESADEIRERVKLRMAASRACPQTANLRNATGPTRRTIEQLAGSFATMAREICQQGAVFPPVEVFHTVSTLKCTVTVRTGPSVPHELAGVLSVRLTIQPLDADASNVKLFAAARLGSDPPDCSEADVALYVGEPSAPRLREIIDVYLHGSLERALGTGNPPAAGLAITLDAKRS